MSVYTDFYWIARYPSKTPVLSVFSKNLLKTFNDLNDIYRTKYKVVLGNPNKLDQSSFFRTSPFFRGGNDLVSVNNLVQFRKSLARLFDVMDYCKEKDDRKEVDAIVRYGKRLDNVVSLIARYFTDDNTTSGYTQTDQDKTCFRLTYTGLEVRCGVPLSV